MSDLKTMIGHPSIKGFEKLRLESNQPMVVERGGETKSLGQPMTTQSLLALLKASLAPEVMSSFQWGKELSSSLEGPEGPISLAIALRADKSIAMTLRPASAKTVAPVAETRAAGGSEDEAGIADEVAALTDAEGTALIYAPSGVKPVLLQALESLGYPVKVTGSQAAALEVLRYHEYPLFLMVLGSDFATDPVYGFLAKRLMEERRTQYSILAAPGLEQGNTLLAFSLSVHLTLNVADISPSLSDQLEKAILAWKRFVAPLHEALQDAGRL